MDKSLNSYNKLLAHPKLNTYLNLCEIAGIFYNRSINHTEMANFYFSEDNFIKALFHMRAALSDIRNAFIRYNSKEDRAACDARIIEYTQKYNHILIEKQKTDAQRSLEVITYNHSNLTVPVTFEYTTPTGNKTHWSSIFEMHQKRPAAPEDDICLAPKKKKPSPSLFFKKRICELMSKQVKEENDSSLKQETLL